MYILISLMQDKHIGIINRYVRKGSVVCIYSVVSTLMFFVAVWCTQRVLEAIATAVKKQGVEFTPPVTKIVNPEQQIVASPEQQIVNSEQQIVNSEEETKDLQAS